MTIVCATIAVGSPATAGAAEPMPACGGMASAAAVGSPSRELAWRAALHSPVPLRADPSRRPRGLYDGRDAPALLVLGARLDERGRCWVRLRLPARPNDASAWVRSDRVDLQPTSWRLVVYRNARRVDVLREGRVVRRFRGVIGAPATPTPLGLFAIADTWRGRPGDFLGSWVVTLTAHSNVLDTFDGGDGRVAIHGRGGTSLLDPLGSARSHGCVRLTNAAISWLVRSIGAIELPGVPVRVE